MKKVLLVLSLLITSSVTAGECKCTTKLIKPDPPKIRSDGSIERDKITHNEVAKHPERIWVEDINQSGLWYYGYYVPVGSSYEFRYSRREYKKSLMNFRSLYHVYYKDELYRSKRPSVRVIYEPAY